MRLELPWYQTNKDSTKKKTIEQCFPRTGMQKFSTKYEQIESNSTQKISLAMIKWDFCQWCKDSLIYTNQ
jgi:hypothetical protein